MCIIFFRKKIFFTKKINVEDVVVVKFTCFFGFRLMKLLKRRGPSGNSPTEVLIWINYSIWPSKY